MPGDRSEGASPDLPVVSLQSVTVSNESKEREGNPKTEYIGAARFESTDYTYSAAIDPPQGAIWVMQAFQPSLKWYERAILGRTSGWSAGDRVMLTREYLALWKTLVVALFGKPRKINPRTVSDYFMLYSQL